METVELARQIRAEALLAREDVFLDLVQRNHNGEGFCTTVTQDETQ
jgi:hypothetical protein